MHSTQTKKLCALFLGICSFFALAQGAYANESGSGGLMDPVFPIEGIIATTLPEEIVMCAETPGTLQLLARLPENVRIQPGDFLEYNIAGILGQFSLDGMSLDIPEGNIAEQYRYITTGNRIYFLEVKDQAAPHLFVIENTLPRIPVDGEVTVSLRLHRAEYTNGSQAYQPVWSATDTITVVLPEEEGPVPSCGEVSIPEIPMDKRPVVERASFDMSSSTDHLYVSILDPDVGTSGPGLGTPSLSNGLDKETFAVYMDDELAYADGDCQEGFVCEMSAANDPKRLTMDLTRQTPSGQNTARVRIAIRNNRDQVLWYDSNTPEPVTWTTQDNTVVPSLPFSLEGLYVDADTHPGTRMYLEVSASQDFSMPLIMKTLASYVIWPEGCSGQYWWACPSGPQGGFSFYLISGEPFSLNMEKEWEMFPVVPGSSGGGGVVMPAPGGGTLRGFDILKPGQTFYVRARIQDTAGGQSPFSAALPLVWREAAKVSTNVGGGSGGGFSGSNIAQTPVESSEAQEGLTPDNEALQTPQETSGASDAQNKPFTGAKPIQISVPATFQFVMSQFGQGKLRSAAPFKLQPVVQCARANAIDAMLQGVREDDFLTRGQMAAALYLAWCENLPYASSTNASFADVASGTDVARVTTALRNANILRGDGDSLFRADDVALYPELIALYLRYTDQMTANRLAEQQTNPWYTAFDRYAQENNLPGHSEHLGAKVTYATLRNLLKR